MEWYSWIMLGGIIVALGLIFGADIFDFLTIKPKTGKKYVKYTSDVSALRHWVTKGKKYEVIGESENKSCYEIIDDHYNTRTMHKSFFDQSK